MSRIHYQLSTASRHRREITITVVIPAEGQSVFALQLPLWRPGRYERQQYERSIGDVQMLTSGASLRRTSTHTWEVETGSNPEIRVQYVFHAARLDAGGSFTDVDLIYLNPVNALLYDPNRPALPCVLEVDIPAGFEVVCALPREGNAWLSASADQLFDSPLLASARMQHHSFSVGENILHLWFHGAHTLDFQKLEVNFRAFTEAQIRLFGNMPCREFHFLFLISEGRSYHGVEHPDSTVITLGPAAELLHGNVWNELLSISSHELFHLWNVKRIRPADLQPYDYTREQYSELHDITEGITTYYGELMLLRSGVWTQAEWLSEMNDILQKHLDAPGKRNMTLRESSYISWVNGYHLEGWSRQKISFYHKGALVAMLLDLKLREMSGHRVSLDTLMKRLWADAQQPDYRGYTRVDILRHLEEMGFAEADAFYQDYVAGTQDVLLALQAILPSAGLSLNPVPSGNWLKSRLGLKITPNADGTALVTGIIPDSPAWRTPIHVGDTLLSLGGEMPASDPDDFLRKHFQENTDLELTYVTRGIHRTCHLQWDEGFEDTQWAFATIDSDLYK